MLKQEYCMQAKYILILLIINITIIILLCGKWTKWLIRCSTEREADAEVLERVEESRKGKTVTVLLSQA